MGKWLPIETAPKGDDYSVLLAFAPDTFDKRTTTPGVMIGYWDAYYAPGGRGYVGGSGWTDTHSGEPASAHYGEPTHWQPLPEPPQ